MNDPRVRLGALVLCGLTAAGGQQIVYLSGQTIAPAFEGWEQNWACGSRGTSTAATGRTSRSTRRSSRPIRTTG